MATHGIDPQARGLANRPNLSAFAGLTGAADKLAYFTGAAAMAVTNLVSQARSFLADPSAAFVSFTLGVTNAVSLSVQDLLRDTVSVRMFGAVCDGTTDDTAAVQAAIDYCLSLSLAGILMVPGTCRITASLIINRAVDTTSDFFIIQGQGVGAGFLVAPGVTLFDSTIPFTAYPVSERVTLRDLRIGLYSGSDAVIFSQKFLRVQLFNVLGRGLRMLNATATYAQDWHIGDGCNFAGWTGGAFFNAKGATEVVSLRTAQYRAGTGDAFYLYDSGGTNGVSGCSIYGSFESIDGSPLKAGGAGGLRFGGYFEGNTGVTADFSLGANTSITLDIELITPTALNLANSSFYEIKWGVTDRGASIGAKTTGRLHDDTSMTSPLVSIGETAALALQKSTRQTRVMASGISSMENNITAHAGGGQASAYQLTATVNRVTIAASAADSVKLPTTYDLGVAQAVTIINDSGNSIQVFGSGTDSINFVASGTGVAQGSVVTATYYSVVAGRWSV